MTRYEKILLYSLLGMVAILTVASYGGGLLSLLIWLTAASYFVGGYWLFAKEPAPPAWVRILAGGCLAVSLYGLSESIRLPPEIIYKALPAVNGIFGVGLGTYGFLKRRTAGISTMLRPLLIRSAVLAGLCGWLVYLPVSNSFSRAALLVLNRGNDHLTSNLLMFEYAALADQALEEKSCAAAINYAQRANKAGKRWLDSDSIEQAYRIGMTNTLLYDAYRCQANASYNQQQYGAALPSYQKAHNILLQVLWSDSVGGVSKPGWQEERTWSLNNLAFCYQKLHQLTISDSLHAEALRAYTQINPIPDLNSARLIRDFAASLKEGRHYDESMILYNQASKSLAKDTTREAIEVRVDINLTIVQNLILLDSLPQADRLLQTLVFPAGDSGLFYAARIDQATSFFLQSRHPEAASLLQSCRRYYRSPAYTGHKNLLTTEFMLARNCVALAAYSQALQHITAAQKIAVQHDGMNSIHYANCQEVLALVNKALGKYTEADQEYAHALSLYQRLPAEGSDLMPGLLMQLTDLDLILGRDAAARSHINDALTQAGGITTPKQTPLLTMTAYVDYSEGQYGAARKGYRQALAINKQFRRLQNATTAAAWNGLGLVETAQRNVAKADSLFAQAQAQHEAVFGKRHPQTAIVYLNYALLRLQQKRGAEAVELLQKAQRIYAACFPVDHDAFGDLNLAFGDLALQQHQAATARDYYRQAYTIFLNKFGDSHWKTKRARRLAAS